MQKIILYYKFVPVDDPDGVRKWQTLLGAERGLRGRVLVSEHGINGTLGGDEEALDDYIEQMESTKGGQTIEIDGGKAQLADFSGITYKWSDWWMG